MPFWAFSFIYCFLKNIKQQLKQQLNLNLFFQKLILIFLNKMATQFTKLVSFILASVSDPPTYPIEPGKLTKNNISLFSLINLFKFTQLF